MYKVTYYTTIFIINPSFASNNVPSVILLIDK
jgi:hypothetical protein